MLIQWPLRKRTNRFARGLELNIQPAEAFGGLVWVVFFNLPEHLLGDTELVYSQCLGNIAWQRKTNPICV